MPLLSLPYPANAILAIVLGLVLGSFANVLVYRLPKSILHHAYPAPQAATAPTLWRPGSFCPHCQTPLRWYENIPLLSFVFLRGRCGHCGLAISWRYPALELCGALCFYASTLRYGFSMTSLAWGLFLLAMVTLLIIDWKHYLLPDVLTLPVLGLGLLLSAFALNPHATIAQALWGAGLGYGFLWSIFHLFRLSTGQEGMGYGDFKLFACIGAWFGWQGLLPVLILSSVSGICIGGILSRYHLQAPKDPVHDADIPEQAFAFGPFLVLAALLLWLWPEMQNWFWSF